MGKLKTQPNAGRKEKGMWVHRKNPGNQGLWRWKLNGKGSCLIPEPVGLAGGSLFSTEVLDIDVATLTSWLFGYERLENLMGEQEERPPWWCRFAEPIERLFLDEVV